MSSYNFYKPKGFIVFYPIAGSKGQPETVHDWMPFGLTVVGRPGVRLSLFVFMVFNESKIVGGIAAYIVKEMLEEAGYFVYAFGYEKSLPSLAKNRLLKEAKDKDVADKIKCMPDLLIVNPEGNAFIVEVKFRSSQRIDWRLKQKILEIDKHWPKAKLLMTYPAWPYFRISTIRDLVRTGELYDLYKDKFVSVEKELIERYGRELKKYLAR